MRKPAVARVIHGPLIRSLFSARLSLFAFLAAAMIALSSSVYLYIFITHYSIPYRV